MAIARAVAAAALCLTMVLAFALDASAQTRTYTTDADFDEGTLISVNHNAPNNDQLQLNQSAGAFKFIWIAISGRGTVVKVDTQTGAILGEYRSSPDGRGKDPSRTTVDNDGNVWLTNRAESGFVAQDAIAPGLPATSRSMGSVAQIGLVENGQCEDRNSNGTIETSTGLGDIKPWLNGGGVDNLGGVSTAEDECILHFTRVNSTGARHVSVNAANDVWVSGTGGRYFDLIDGDLGTVVRQELPVPFGGYGGLIDANGVIWSARNLLRWDTALPLTGANGDPAGVGVGPPAAGTNWAGDSSFDSYGLCIDPNDGSVWNTQLSGDRIHKYASDGSYIGGFPHGNFYAQGCVVDSNGDVWVAHSLFSATTVGHILADGTYVGNVPLLGGNGPTGMAVDADGKVWSANINSNSASRIDPAGGAIGGGGVPIGAVDLTVALGAGAAPYNYSDMTGSTLAAAPNNGNWTVVYNSGTPGAEWGVIDWNATVPGDAALSVTVASSSDGVTFGPPMPVANGGDVAAADGQYLRISVAFARSSGGMSPVLFDLTVRTVQANDTEPPVCGAITFDMSGPGRIISSATDNVGIVRATFVRLTKLDGYIDAAGPFAQGDVYDLPSPAPSIAIEGVRINVANRRAAIVVRVEDAAGNTANCDPVLDQLDSASDVTSLGQSSPNPTDGATSIPFSLAEPGPVRLAVYDMLGREVAVIVDRDLGPGTYELSWDGTDALGRALSPGTYVYRLRAGAFSAVQRLTLVR